MKTLKSIQIVCLSLLAGYVLLTACEKNELEVGPTSTQNADFKTIKPVVPEIPYLNWREDFATANSLNSKWILYGTSKPRWTYFACNRYGLFDNNGEMPYGSFAVSKSVIGNGNGYTIESDVCINITNPKGTVICPEIGVTRSLNVPAEPQKVEAGISMKLMYLGRGVPNLPEEYLNHTYVIMTVLLKDGTFATSGDLTDITSSKTNNSPIRVDFAGNGWHKLKIVVNASQKVSFYLDNQFVWSPEVPIHESLMKNKNVLIGFVSPGSAGKAYHDYVKVTYPLIGDPLSAEKYTVE